MSDLDLCPKPLSALEGPQQAEAAAEHHISMGGGHDGPGAGQHRPAGAGYQKRWREVLSGGQVETAVALVFKDLLVADPAEDKGLQVGQQFFPVQKEGVMLINALAAPLPPARRPGCVRCRY